MLAHNLGGGTRLHLGRQLCGTGRGGDGDAAHGSGSIKAGAPRRATIVRLPRI